MNVDARRIAALARAVADRVTDEMLTTPVGELADFEVALLRAAIVGPYADEIVERLDRINRERGTDGRTTDRVAVATRSGEGRPPVAAPAGNDSPRGSPRCDTSNAIRPTQGATVTPLTREQIEQKRAEAMAARAPAAAPRAPGAAAPGTPNQSRLTLARAAIRPEMKGRVMLSGPAGAGKTYTSLVVATALVGVDGKILVVDTEKESSLTYADVFDFDQLPWNPPFDPTALSLTLKAAAAGYDCVIVDSFSHFWRKQGGVLDIAGDNVRGWKAARPIQENLIETLLDVDMHVIVCCRSKMEHLIEDLGQGRIRVTKAGIKAQQDDDLEYEVNVALEIDMPHVLSIVKSRTNAVPVGSTFLAGLAGDFAQQYRDWLRSGEPVADKTDTDALAAGLDQIADPADRQRVKYAFLDAFGRPEFLLVSRLAEAQQWVVDAVNGRLPVERGEDDTPPDPEPPASPPSGSTDSPPESAVSASQPSNGPSDRNGNTTQQGAADAAPAVANGDTGHCGHCGAPIWYAAGERDGGPGWLHADPDDLDHCPVDGPTVPAGPDADVDALFAATQTGRATQSTGDVADFDAAAALIRAEVASMTPTKVVHELELAGLSINGTPKVCKQRLLDFRLAQPVDSTT